MAVILGDAGHYVTVDLDYVVAEYVVPPARVSTAVTPTGTLVAEAISSVSTSFVLQADVGVIRGTSSVLATSGNITADGTMSALATSSLITSFEVTANGGLEFTGSAGLFSQFTTSAIGNLIQFSDRQMWNIEAESRSYTLDKDGRNWTPTAESRSLTIEK